MKRKFYEETGMFIDWMQIRNLPDIDVLVDIGVGAKGTPMLYERFASAQLILIDPLIEAKEYAEKLSKQRNVSFFLTALGRAHTPKTVSINVENTLGRSSLLKASEINSEGPPSEVRSVAITNLDTIMVNPENMGRIGIKIDVEGYEYEVILGATNTLRNAKFVLAEVRHNHESFDGQYKLYDFVRLMAQNGYYLSMILTAKPFIADLCFQKVADQ